MQTIDRRSLMKLAAAALATAIAACDNRPIKSASFSEAEIELMLTRLAMDLFPHKSVASRKYQSLARLFQEQSREVSLSLAKSLSAPEVPFDQFTGTQRLEFIQQQLFSPELLAFRFHAAVSLYADLDVTRAFGYQGPSLDDGGYIDRGFNDLDWLPDPS